MGGSRPGSPEAVHVLTVRTPTCFRAPATTHRQKLPGAASSRRNGTDSPTRR